MRENNLLEADVDFEYLSENTVNYTGAEIEAVVRSATSYALFKDVNLNDGQTDKQPSSVASKLQVDKKKNK